ncbi:MAG: tRNA 2-thiouridine(34) synthase MnmA [Verrucomicrobia bacterium]|nr:tRNA 2-thiouridine(34) synthase MnmA [Verrucomicrobiota bacterium]
MRTLVAMSGGVDSSVAAALLVREGHDVSGAYMKNWINEENIIGHCPWQQDIEDARAVADQLSLDFRVVNLMEEYREKVVKYLLEGYTQGITPNPDVMCNREMKFGVLWDWARENGFDAIATGHYARKDEGGRMKDESGILKGLDPNKDQTYFLAMGHLLKPQVREEARKLGLSTAEKKDSQGICFIGEVKMEDFLRTFVPDKPGPIVNLEGKVLGEHRGLHLYTFGQRKGIGVASNLHKQAYVVVAKRPEANELVIAIERPDTPLLWAKRCIIGGISTTGPDLSAARRIEAMPRYRSPAAAAAYKPYVRADGLAAELVFDEAQRALTPGQICAFYDGERLLGGGVFEEICYE